MTKTPEEKATVQKNRTVQTNSEKTNLTAEEKAREYAGITPDVKNVNNLPETFSLNKIKYQTYLDVYHSRDEEVKAYRKALKECIENIECIEANVNHAEGFFNAMMNATTFCAKAKQLLNNE